MINVLHKQGAFFDKKRLFFSHKIWQKYFLKITALVVSHSFLGADSMI
jgi:hypothetical protein